MFASRYLEGEEDTRRKRSSDPRWMRVAIYCRKSNDEDGRSKSRFEQLEKCESDAEWLRFEPENVVSKPLELLALGL